MGYENLRTACDMFNILIEVLLQYSNFMTVSTTV